MIRKKRGFTLDWKWTPSDILFEVKKIIPKFTFSVEKESGPTEKILFIGSVMGEKMNFHTPLDKPIEFLKKINPAIESSQAKNSSGLKQKVTIIALSLYLLAKIFNRMPNSLHYGI